MNWYLVFIDQVYNLGEEYLLEYFHIWANNIQRHNKEVEEKVCIIIIIVWYNSCFAARSRHRYFKGKMTRGQMDMSCPDCGERIAWGNVSSVITSKNILSFNYVTSGSLDVVVQGSVRKVGSHLWIEIDILFIFTKWEK